MKIKNILPEPDYYDAAESQAEEAVNRQIEHDSEVQDASL